MGWRLLINACSDGNNCVVVDCMVVGSFIMGCVVGGQFMGLSCEYAFSRVTDVLKL